MNCLSNAPSFAAAIFRRASRLFAAERLYSRSVSAWRITGGFPNATVRAANSGIVIPSGSVHCYSSKPRRSKKSSLSALAPDAEAAPAEKDAFFVVRKGDLVGVYRSFRDCQAQIGSSICDPPVSIYKGNVLLEDTEDYLTSRGLKNALYTIRAADLNDDVFGLLSPCPVQEPSPKNVKDKSKDVTQDKATSTPDLTNSLNLNVVSAHDIPTAATAIDCRTCTLQFDGASKGNPGKAGAGAVLRSLDGNVICRVREGAGSVTCNVAEYRAIILGLRYALQSGYTNIKVQGDSKLICMQVGGLWKVRNKNLSELWKQVQSLKEEFHSFEISHVLRALNSEADAEANKAITLNDGEVEEECVQVIQHD